MAQEEDRVIVNYTEDQIQNTLVADLRQLAKFIIQHGQDEYYGILCLEIQT